MKIKFDNWRDQRGSELEKAQALIANKNISLKDLADKCKFSSYSTLRHDRVNLEKLEDASYKRIHELAKIYDWSN